MDWLTSSTLLERLAESREQDGWTLVVEHFRPPLVALGRRMGLRDEDAEDAAQNTLAAFAEGYRAGQYQRDKGRLRQWLYGIATRQIQNQRRRIHGPGPVGTGQSVSFLDAVPAGGASPESLWDEEWRRAVYERSLLQVQAEIAPQTFEIFRQLVFDERGADDVAAQLGVSRTQVYNAKYRVAKRLGELARAYEDA
jgi:RNA polymerase sigma factor (sigma-70 family)